MVDEVVGGRGSGVKLGDIERVNMADAEYCLKRFHEAFELLIQHTPKFPDQPTRVLRRRLIIEEFLEYLLAEGASGEDIETIRILLTGKTKEGNVLEEHETSGVDYHDLAADLPEVADALADLVYVIVGTAVSYGIPFNRIFAEVHRSNMTKLWNGKVRKDEGGKVIKSPEFEPPRIARILGTYGWKED